MQEENESGADGANKPTSRGRPRDPKLEDRVFDAAAILYSNGGWATFNFDAVARMAGVGKAALYRRWGTRAELLRATLETRWYQLTDIDTGNVRGDLIALARMFFRQETGPYSGMGGHFRSDAQKVLEVLPIASPQQEKLIREARTIVRHAIDRGELPDTVDPNLILDLICGAIYIHVGATPERLRGTMISRAENYIDSLVDVVMRGVGIRG